MNKLNTEIQVLVSTMNQTDCDKLAKKMNIINYIIINQITKKTIKPSNYINKNNSCYSVKEKGLSKSRNLNITLSTAEICVIADDDLIYFDDYEDKILKAYDKYKDADIIAFDILDEKGNLYGKYIKEGRINLITSMRLSSVRLTFRSESIKKSGIKFNESFGAGAEYYMGEDNIFLSDCLKAGLKIYYIKKTIARLTPSESTWFKSYDAEYFNIKGRVFYEMSHHLYLLFTLQFIIRKYSSYKSNISPMKALSFMLQGSNNQKRNYA